MDIDLALGYLLYCGGLLVLPYFFYRLSRIFSGNSLIVKIGCALCSIIGTAIVLAISFYFEFWPFISGSVVLIFLSIMLLNLFFRFLTLLLSYKIQTFVFKLLAFLPTILIVWAGINYPAEENSLTSILGFPSIWVIICLIALHKSIYFVSKINGEPFKNLFYWLKEWPGWNLSIESPYERKENWVTLSSIPTVLLLVDSILKFSNIFPASQKLYYISSFICTIVFAVSAFLFYRSMNIVEIIENKQVPTFSIKTRLLNLSMFVFAFILWSSSIAYEPESDLKIVIQDLPSFYSRSATITVSNTGNTTKILKEIHVESRSIFIDRCLGGVGDVTDVGEYNIDFDICGPITKFKINPLKQFPAGSVGNIKVGLNPITEGICSPFWTAKVRMATVSEDGKRSKTSWFTIGHVRRHAN